MENGFKSMKLRNYMKKEPVAAFPLVLAASILFIIFSAIGPALADDGRTESETDSAKTADGCSCCLNDYGFDQENSSIWIKSDWMNNDPIYLNKWSSNPWHNRIKDGNLILNLDDYPCRSDKSQCQGRDLASGEYSTVCDQYRYGNLSAKILAGKGDGVVTGMFLMGGVAGKQDEIDLEILGKEASEPGKWEIQTNYYVKGSQGNCWEPYGIPETCHVAIIPLNFDPTESYHIYNVSWIGKEENCRAIQWFIDGKLRRYVWKDEKGYIQSNVFDENGEVIEAANPYKGELPSKQSKIFLSLWAAQNWSLAGEFNYDINQPISSKFDWIKYSPLEI